MKKILLLGLLVLSGCSGSVSNSVLSNNGRGDLKETYYDTTYYQQIDKPHEFVVYIDLTFDTSTQEYKYEKEYYVDIDDVHYMKKTSVELPNNVLYVYTHDYLLIIYD